jgi:uncharacterized FAD-dependent dehydrogenase
MVVTVEIKDALEYFKKAGNKSQQIENSNPDDPLLLMKFQQAVEQKAFQAGGGKFVAPAQRMVDMFDKKTSAVLPACSYLPEVRSVELSNVLPGFIYNDLRLGFQAFGQKMRGYFTNDAVLVATESRTSSPVRVPRDADTLQHPQIQSLYPCGEGAGFAGGIVSAAMDGERVAAAITKKIAAGHASF